MAGLAGKVFVASGKIVGQEDVGDHIVVSYRGRAHLRDQPDRVFDIQGKAPFRDDGAGPSTSGSAQRRARSHRRRSHSSTRSRSASASRPPPAASRSSPRGRARPARSFLSASPSSSSGADESADVARLQKAIQKGHVETRRRGKDSSVRGAGSASSSHALTSTPCRPRPATRTSPRLLAQREKLDLALEAEEAPEFSVPARARLGSQTDALASPRQPGTKTRGGPELIIDEALLGSDETEVEMEMEEPQKRTGTSVSKKKKGASGRRAQKSGLEFPIARVGRELRQGAGRRRVSEAAAVGLAAALEYVAAEWLDTSSVSARTARRRTLAPKDFQASRLTDAEMKKLLSGVHLRRP